VDCAWIGCAKANPERAAIVVNMRMIVPSVSVLLEEDHLVTTQPSCRIMVPGPSRISLWSSLSRRAWSSA
ncbi:hypothetical protein, partial [Mesorhizobium sp.]|uniref:hypothetical protein n=1 Tax=Mesorhizobium sp. TaxID=1871066 RepID=UPI00257E78CE